LKVSGHVKSAALEQSKWFTIMQDYLVALGWPHD
jgi:hypothetical protein